MRAPCSKDCGRSPFACEPAEASARLFLCKRCRDQMLICSRCDRGHVYCDGCAEAARRQGQREAGKRYQATRKGRRAHAARQCAYRARRNDVTRRCAPADVAGPARAAAYAKRFSDPYQTTNRCGRRGPAERSDVRRSEKEVTHHGSRRRPADDFVRADARATRLSHCHWCGCRCSPFVRLVFLRR
jgi:hypothetical protein